MSSELQAIFQRRQLTGPDRYEAGPKDAPSIAIVVPNERSPTEKHFLSFSRILCPRFRLVQIEARELAQEDEQKLEKDHVLSLSRFLGVIVPGGSVFEVQETIGIAGAKRINQFVYNGGGYVGTCCGAFLASRIGYDGACEEFAMLGVRPGDYFPGQGKAVVDIFDGNTVFTSSSSPSTSSSTATKKAGISLFYCNGQTYKCATKKRTNKYLGIAIPPAMPLLELACIETNEVRPSGARPTTSTGRSLFAAVAGNFGNGRVVAFGPHPESVSSGPDGNRMVLEAMVWATGR